MTLHQPITPNLRVSESADGFCITADARKPAPEFASLLHRLAHPGPYGGSTNQAYMRACDQIDAAFKIKPDTKMFIYSDKRVRIW